MSISKEDQKMLAVSGGIAAVACIILAIVFEALKK